MVRTALARKTVAFDGVHYQLPLPDGPGQAAQADDRTGQRAPADLPGRGRPKNLELAGEMADGWLAVFYAPDYAADQLGHVRAGREQVGETLDGFDVVPTVPLVVGDDPRACADPVRGVRGALRRRDGQPEQNFYNALAVRMGYADAAAKIQDLYLDRRHRDAMAAVPFEFIDQTSLLGDRRADRRPTPGPGRVGRDHLLAGPVRQHGGGEARHPDRGRRGVRAGRGRLTPAGSQPSR